MDKRRMELCFWTVKGSVVGIIGLTLISAFFPQTTIAIGYPLEALKAALFTGLGYAFGNIR
jgi:hypothetical protein